MSPITDFLANNLHILNLVAYVANIGLVNGVPLLFRLPDNGAISQKYQTIVTPAGWAFAIWGLIFLMQLIWATLQFVVPSIRTNPLVVQGVGYDYLGACAAQVAWTFAFAFEQITLSMMFMVAILVYLARIYQHQQAMVADDSMLSSVKNYWLLQFPFGLHFGWIIAATLLNANLVLVAHPQTFGATQQLIAAVGTLVVLLAVTAVTLWREAIKSSPDLVLPLVFVWALNAIYTELKNPKALILDTFTADQISLVQRGAEAAGVIVFSSVVLVTVHSLWKHYTGQHSVPSERQALLNEH